jgi:GTPase KRas
MRHYLIDSYRKEITIGTERHVVDILDTAYDEEYSSMRQRYLRIMNGIIICVPIDKDVDFNNLENDFMEPILRVKDVDRYDPVVRFL